MYRLVTPIIRHILQAIGGALVAAGYLDQSMLEAFIGAGINIGAILWWQIERRMVPAPVRVVTNYVGEVAQPRPGAFPEPPRTQTGPITGWLKGLFRRS